MIQDRPFHKALIYFIPAITILWSLYLVHIAGPFYLTRIDPEFPYLLNGLNCARLDFSRIGHIDHPGTPFQLLTGLFISITYWIGGQGTLVEDVISRPELYLTWSTFYLNLIVAGILLWFGKLVYNNKGSVLELVILQSAFFIGNVLIDLPSRYIPDRLLEIMVYVFIGLCYQYFYTKNFSGRKFAIYSGMVMGVGFITKFNFLPVLLVPFVLVAGRKEKFIYIAIFVITAFIMFLPVINEYNYFKEFITSIIRHDGLYGGGSEQVFNTQYFWNNTWLIFRSNVSFTIVSILSIFGIGYLLVKSDLRKQNFNEFLFLISNVLAITIAVVMVSKHYKSYYLVPVVSLIAFVLLVVKKLSFKVTKVRAINYVFGVVLLLLIYFPSSMVYPLYKAKDYQHHNNTLITNFIHNNIPSIDYFLIEPTWMAGPIKENGLVYGVSYVAFRHYYYNEFERIYPNLLTWEGDNNPIRYFRMLDANNETIFKSGKSIYVLSTPGRNASQLSNYIIKNFNQLDIRYSQDTVFINSTTNEYIIRFQNNDGWQIKSNVRFGFEKLNNGILYSDDGQYTMKSELERSMDKPTNGQYNLKVLPNQQSPEYIFDNAIAGDFIEVSIKRKRNNSEPKGNLHLYFSIPDSANLQIASGEFISHISSYHEMIRLTAEIPALPDNAILKCCYFNSNETEEFVDDFTIKQFRKE